MKFLITAFAASKHCGVMLVSIELAILMTVAYLRKENFVSMLKTALIRLLEPKGKHNKPRVVGQAENEGKPAVQPMKISGYHIQWKECASERRATIC